MKIYGSLHNRLMENSKPATPALGDGATVTSYSDRHPATVIKVHTPKKVTVQFDDYQRIDTNGASEDQDYAYTPNPEGATSTFTLRKSGRWVELKGSRGILFGHRERYYDFSF